MYNRTTYIPDADTQIRGQFQISGIDGSEILSVTFDDGRVTIQGQPQQLVDFLGALHSKAVEAWNATKTDEQIAAELDDSMDPEEAPWHIVLGPTRVGYDSRERAEYERDMRNWDRDHRRRTGRWTVERNPADVQEDRDDGLDAAIEVALQAQARRSA